MWENGCGSYVFLYGSWSVVNTAVLTGRQVSRAMKVLIVSQAGKVADVTLQSSCTCTDEAALKVSSSCTSVYLDGSEVRGSHNATVVARYGQRSGSASFTVWMPEFPLEVYVEDTKLSQMKGWKSPKESSAIHYSPKEEEEDEVISGGGGLYPSCYIRYQQTPVQVYGRFVAVDDNSGRESYLLSRKASVRVTELVTHLLRVSDTSVASLEQTILKGKSPGRTEVQVLSPITGRVIGAKEIRVGTDKVWINRLQATIISGLTLSLQPDLQITDGYAAITTITPTLTAKYQEGLIDVWVEFSDGSSTALREMHPDAFSLTVTSLDSSVVAVAPSPSEAQPRVIAIGHGEGDLLQVSLKLPEACGSLQNTLATTSVKVKVDLGANSFSGVHFGDEHHTYPEEALKNDDDVNWPF
ncbi:Transmembrane protein [Armadillidium vulgare]|nr:Transmembrane protein [Armadillidium vulgare]